MSRLLRLASPGLTLRVTDESLPFHTVVDDWHIAEHHVADIGEYGPYNVTMEMDVPPGEDVGSAYISGEAHAQALEKAWLYGTGLTLSGRGFDFFLHPVQLPSGWSSNAREVVPNDDWTLLHDGVALGDLRRTSQVRPLRHCIDVLWALARADEVLVQLSTYHLGAVSSLDRDLPFLLLAQGLEIARALLPGDSKKAQAAHLPAAVIERLPRGLDWLFGVSNQRRETRHAIDKQSEVVLKPAFEEDEERDFLEGANLILHFVVTSRLQLPLIVNESGTSSTIVPAVSNRDDR